MPEAQSLYNCLARGSVEGRCLQSVAICFSAFGLHGSRHQSLNRTKEQLKKQMPPPQNPGWCRLMHFQLAGPRGVNKAHMQKVLRQIIDAGSIYQQLPAKPEMLRNTCPES